MAVAQNAAGGELLDLHEVGRQRLPSRAQRPADAHPLIVGHQHHPVPRSDRRTQEVLDLAEHAVAIRGAEIVVVDEHHEREGGGLRGRSRRGFRRRRGAGGRHGGRFFRDGRRALRQLGEIDDLDLLAVHEQLEIAAGQPLDVPAVAVGHGDLDIGDADVDRFGERLIGDRLLAGQQGEGEQQGDGRKKSHPDLQ